MNSLIGSVLSNKYKVLEVVGTGGMAVVYKGKDLRLGRNVAIKVLKSEYLNDQQFIERFQTESMAIAHLSHPNIVNVYDVGFEDDLKYIVMELVTGRTLKEHIASHPGFMKEEAVINIGIQIGSALSQAHSKGVVHRDIKPHNILIDNDGRVKVADFGIARAMNENTIVKTTNVFGSVHYTSPEQARGESVDERSDIYSFGILLYELITKSLPYDGDTPVSVAMQHINKEIPNPKTINPAMSQGLAEIIYKATQKNKEDRYQSAYDMVSDLRKLKLDHAFVPAFDDEQEDEILNDLSRLGTIRGGSVKKNRKKIPVEIENKQEEKETSSKLNTIIFALSGIVLALIVVAAIFIFRSNVPKENTIVEMPNVIDMEAETAIQFLRQNGLKATITEYKNSDDVATGNVISASIDQGTELKRGYTIKLVVSKGSKNRIVPNLVGMKMEEAKKSIVDAGFASGSVKKEYSDTVEIGYVIAQSPEKDEHLKMGSMIDIVVSSGKKLDSVMVPSLSTLTIRKADSTLAQLGLKLGKIEREFNDEFLEGTVIKNTRVGENVPFGTSVDLLVSNGPVEKETPTTESEESTGSTEESSEGTFPNTGSSESQDSTEATDQTGDTPETSEGQSETSGTENSAYKEMDVTVIVDVSKFDTDPTVIRVDFLNNNQKKIVYQGEHSQSEGDTIEIKLHLTGAGPGKLLVYYGSFLKQEQEANFE